MAYFDRLKQMKYTAPSGQEFILDFNELSRTLSKKYALNEYTQINTADLQDLGNAANRYPVSCYIHGADYDRQADSFAAALSERGAGTLEHPRWGTIQVLPISVNQNETFVEGAGKATFEIEFIKYVPPKEQFKQQKLIADQQSAAAAALVDSTIVDKTLSAGAVKVLAARTRNLVSQTTTFTDSIVNFADDINSEIEATANKILRGANNLASAPLELARVMLDLYRLPLQISASAENMVNGYKKLVDDIKNGFTAVSENYGFIDAAVSTSAATAAAESLLVVDYQTREQALNAVATAAELAYNYQQSIGEYSAAAGFALPVDLMSQVQSTFTAAIEQVIDESIDLPTEQIKITDAEYTPIELLYQFGGSVNDLELFIDYNNLQGDSILLVPQNTEVRWFER